MTIRKLAKRFVSTLPWHVRKSITDVRANWRARKQPFEGVYSSFDEFQSTMIAAEEDQVCAAIQALNESRRHQGGLLHHRRGRGVLSQAVAILANDDRTIRVLDYGGAAGADFNNLLISNGNCSNISYHVVDFPAVCEAAKKLWKDESRISFSSEQPGNGERFDVVYSWGAVQYAPDPIALLASFAKYQAKVIIIVGTAFSNHGFIRRQVNQTVSFPHWVIDIQKTEDAMLAAGYRLACRQSIEGHYNVDNFDADHRVPDYASLLFVPVKLSNLRS